MGLGAQDVLSPLHYNPLLSPQNSSYQLKSSIRKDSINYLIDYPSRKLPFIDEFSTNRQRPSFQHLQSPIDDRYYIGKCVKYLGYKTGLYKYSKTPSYQDIYDGSKPPFYISDAPFLPLQDLYELADSPLCSNSSLVNLWPPTIMKRFSATGELLWDSVIYDTILEAARVKSYVNTNALWTDRQAYINSHLPYLPISKGVATLDGLNEYGRPYTSQGINTYGSADSLTSVPIDLSPYTGSDSLYLSFYIQQQGLGDNPNLSDSIVLELKDDRNRWYYMWGKKGTADQEMIVDSVPFKFVNIYVPNQVVPSDPNYFHDKFQFRFRNHATISGNNDHWHIDFVKLDDQRTFDDSALVDFNFVYELPSVLKSHTLLPTQQYRGLPDLADTILGWNRNITGGGAVVGEYKYQCTNDLDGTVYANTPLGLVYNRQPLVNISLNVKSELNFPTTVADSSFITTRLIFDPLDTYTNNDTASTRQFFFNEMAYDDGSAEWAYGVQGLGTKKFAYRFYIPNKDTLAAVKILFSNIHEPVLNLVFNLVVWKTIGMNGNEEKVMNTISNLKPIYCDTLNGMVTLGLDQPLEVQDTIYVGWEQTDDRNLQIGYDVNSKKGYENIFIQSNNVWSKSNITKNRAGSPMIRLILDGVRKYSTNSIVEKKFEQNRSQIQFYPNPAASYIRFSGDIERNLSIQVFDMVGKQVLFQKMNEDDIDVSNLQSGLYIVHVRNSDGLMVLSDKLLISK